MIYKESWERKKSNLSIWIVRRQSHLKSLKICLCTWKLKFHHKMLKLTNFCLGCRCFCILWMRRIIVQTSKFTSVWTWKSLTKLIMIMLQNSLISNLNRRLDALLVRNILILRNSLLKYTWKLLQKKDLCQLLKPPF